jgi:hypothetical protein
MPSAGAGEFVSVGFEKPPDAGPEIVERRKTAAVSLAASSVLHFILKLQQQQKSPIPERQMKAQSKSPATEQKKRIFC